MLNHAAGEADFRLHFTRPRSVSEEVSYRDVPQTTTYLHRPQAQLKISMMLKDK